MKLPISKDIYLREGSEEEILPNTSADFQYLALYVSYENYNRVLVPWHWHRPFEICYIERGYREFRTPNKSVILGPGMGAIVNTNILHSTNMVPGKKPAAIKSHQIAPELLYGTRSGRIYNHYFKPYLTQKSFEMVTFSPDVPEEKKILDLLRDSFEVEDETPGFEIRICSELSKFWLEFIKYAGHDIRTEEKVQGVSNDTARKIMKYIYAHYDEKIYVRELADAAFISERECYRLFTEHLKETPGEYIQNYRISIACDRLVHSRMSITEIGRSCGLGSSSYFGKTFKEKMGCTPLEYRKTMAE